MTTTAFGSARFVGRDQELAEFRGWLGEAQAGAGAPPLWPLSRISESTVRPLIAERS